MTVKVKELEAGKLRQDDELLDLRPVDTNAVTDYRDMFRAGLTPEPLIVEAGTMKVIAGNHRLTAALAECGKDHKLPCIVRKYKDRAALLRDAVRDNLKHGVPLRGWMRQKYVNALLNAGQDEHDIAQLFGASIKRVKEWGGLRVVVTDTKCPEPVKRNLSHLAGQTVTRDQLVEHQKRDTAMPAATHARQLTRWIRNGWIKDDANTADALAELAQALEEHLFASAA